ncbi:MAG: rhodanese-like domain-containing protein [Leptolyngbya sp. DLM2.Bin27]|nr:MAG: rhodanese-like domain-containing protein [Leptolyngbya sp. DLM2.Bin27]
MANQPNQNNSLDRASGQVIDQVKSAKAAVTAPLPSPPAMNGQQSTPKELLSRLQWGEPALTIIDTRSREAFNEQRITGAVSMPKHEAFIAPDLELNRDIYVYGDSPEGTAESAHQFRQAGYTNVAELTGGLSGWKQISGPVEGAYALS